MSGRLKYKIVDMLASWVFRLPKSVLARVVAKMVQTGEGTDACLAWHSLPLPVHFYSPIPDIDDLRARNIWNKRSELSGVDFQPEAQRELLLKLGAQYGAECDWPAKGKSGMGVFFTENNSFSFGCAASTHCMIRWLRPKRVIEVGSGNSSIIIKDALLRNMAEGGGHPGYTVIDPYPSDATKKALEGVAEIKDSRVELVHPSFFDKLGEGDVLFIDSGHTVRIGGDVNFLYLDVLPRLARGVVVHIHDIPMPYEYPEVYATNPKFRQFWTESYLLQAFLSHNNSFEVLMGMYFLQRDFPREFAKSFQHFNPVVHKQQAASFWMRRKPT